MTTDYCPYIVMESVFFCKVFECLSLGKAMADKQYPHLSADFERAIKLVRNNAEYFVGTQNKPICKKAYSTL